MARPITRLNRERVRALYVEPEFHKKVASIAVEEGKDKKAITEAALLLYFRQRGDTDLEALKQVAIAN